MDEFKIDYHDEAVSSPLGRVFFCRGIQQTTMNCAIGLKYPIDVTAIKQAILNSIMIKHPRFCSLIVRDHKGREHWKKTHVNIDEHIILHQISALKDDHDDDDDEVKEEAAINSFLAEIAVSTPLSENKPLWELHVLMGLRCVVLRVHHGLGDGVSLMSMLSACFGQRREVMNGQKREWREKGVWSSVKSLWYTFVFGPSLLGRILWVKDKASVISGGDGVELLPRKLATAKFLLEDFKAIKLAIPKATINDVLLGVISSGLSKYLNVKSPEVLLQGLQLTTFITVNLRKDPFIQEMSDLMKTNSKSGLSGWGNKTGSVLIPIHCCNEHHPLDHVRAIKATMDKRKQSYEAHLPYITGNFLVSCLGPKVASWCTRRSLCNTTLIISNIKGPTEEMAIANNPVTYLRLNISSVPHAITMHMVSYAGKVDLQVMVAKDIIPDPEVLVTCFQDSLLRMKNSI